VVIITEFVVVTPDGQAVGLLTLDVVLGVDWRRSACQPCNILPHRIHITYMDSQTLIW